MNSNIQLKNKIVTFKEGVQNAEKELFSIQFSDFQNGPAFYNYFEFAKSIIEDFKRYLNYFRSLQLNETSVAWDMGVLIPLQSPSKNLYINHESFWAHRIEMVDRESELGAKLYEVKKLITELSKDLVEMIRGFVYDNLSAKA